MNGADITVVDLNGDGADDIVATIYGRGGVFGKKSLGYLLFLRNNGFGGFEPIVVADDLGVRGNNRLYCLKSSKPFCRI